MKILDNLKKNTIFLLLITIIILYILLKDDFGDIIKAFEKIKVAYILLAIIIYFIVIFIKSYIDYKITNDKEKISLKEAIKHCLITQFFNGITPFSTGGQPMEIYMLTEHGISLTKATNQTVQSFIFYQIALVICGIVAVCYNYFFHIFPKNILLKKIVLLGFVINIAVVILLISISYSKKVTKRISKIVIFLAKKFHIKINEKEMDKKFNNFYNGFQELKERKGLFVLGITFNIISLVLLYTIPLIITYSMGDHTSLTMMKSITASAYVYVIGSFVPIPGASGGIEYGFTQFYGNFISLDKISAVLIIWRSITYYLGIIIGGLLFNLEKK